MLCAKCGRQLNGGICSCGYDHGAEEVLYLTMPSETLQLTSIVAEMEITDGVLVRYRGTAREVVVPEGVREIGKHAFTTKPVERVMLPSTVTKLDTWAFYRCSSLREINLPAGLQEIGSWAFDGCTALQEITIPEGASLSAWTFRGCTALEKVTFLPGFKSIGTYAFKDCTALREVTIPDSVIFVSPKAFEGCGEIQVIVSDWWKQSYPDELRKIGVSQISIEVADISSMEIEDGVLVKYHGSARVVIVPEGVREIGRQAFAHKSIERVVLPSTVTKLNSWVFYGCSSLREINLPENLQEIGSWAFDGCAALRKITLPGNLRRIGISTFRSCTSLETVTISSGVKDLPPNAFKDCTALREVTVPDSLIQIFHNAFDGCGEIRVVASEQWKRQHLDLLYLIENR